MADVCGSGAIAVASGGKPELIPNAASEKKPRTKRKEGKESEPGEASSIAPLQLEDAPKSRKRLHDTVQGISLMTQFKDLTQ